MSLASSSLPRDVAVRAGHDSDRIRLRRCLTLLVMTLVLPGSAQLVAGSKRLGRIAVRLWLALLAVALMLVVIAFVRRSLLLTLVTDPRWLLMLRVALIVVALGWVALLCDAWRLGDPIGLRRGHRLAMVGVTTALCLVTGGALLFSSHLVAVQRDFIASVFGGGVSSDPYAGRYNVLLLGGDSGSDRSGLRPDSITVASIDQDTGKTVLFGLPRNLQNVQFPQGTVMAERFPDGFDCDGCYLNGVYTWAVDHAELFPGVDDPGVLATKQAVEGVTGLPINYYAMVNLKGFQDLVDAVGGVTINVPEDIPIGGIGGEITGYVPAGEHKLDGYQTLWFARSRVADDDYSRMARQKCVLNAMLRQLDPGTVVTSFGDIAAAGKQVISTSIPTSQLATFVNLAMKTKQLPVATVSFVPPRVNTSDPDYALIRELVARAIAKAEAKDAGTTRDGPPRTKRRNANDSSDLTSSC